MTQIRHEGGTGWFGDQECSDSCSKLHEAPDGVCIGEPGGVLSAVVVQLLVLLAQIISQEGQLVRQFLE